MIKKSNINWNAKQLVKMCVNGSAVFDNAVQRGLVWDVKRMSLLIDSMIQGYPIPPFYAKRGENKVFDMLDGKQRANAMCRFINDEFALDGVSEEYEGCCFDDLPEEVCEKILNYSLTVYYFEDITDEEICEMFYRLNNGKALSAIELTRVKARSFNKIKALATHEIFKDALKESQINRYANEDIVIKALVMLNCEKPSLENNYIRPYIIGTEITEEMAEAVDETLTRIKEIRECLVDNGDIKQAKKLYTRTHLVSLVPLVHKNLDKDVADMAGFVSWFYNPQKRATSISYIYNTHSTSGSNSVYAVGIRQKELTEHFEKFIAGGI